MFGKRRIVAALVVTAAGFGWSGTAAATTVRMGYPTALPTSRALSFTIVS